MERMKRKELEKLEELRKREEKIFEKTQDETEEMWRSYARLSSINFEILILKNKKYLNNIKKFSNEINNIYNTIERNEETNKEREEILKKLLILRHDIR